MWMLLSVIIVTSFQTIVFVPVDGFVIKNHPTIPKLQHPVTQNSIQRQQQQSRNDIVRKPEKSTVLFDQLFESTSSLIPNTIRNEKIIVPRSVVLVNTTHDDNDDNDDITFQESRFVSTLVELQNSVEAAKSILEVTEQQASTILQSTTATDITQNTIQDQLLSTSMTTNIVDISNEDTEPVLVQETTATATATTPMIVAPTVMKIIKFAIPAIGVWLCNPILSLIDTSAVGLFSGVSQQAALNPATAVTDYTALLIAFMYTGSTNLMAAARENNGIDGTRTTFRGALQLSTYVGVTLGILLLLFSKILLRTIIGNDTINPDVFVAAMKYVKIRSLGMPAAAFIGSAQAACLGMQDIKSPLYVLVAAAVVNLVGDLLFVPSSHPWIGGAAGAAWATVISQYAAASLFYLWLTSSTSRQNKRNKSSTNTILNSNDMQSGPTTGSTTIRNKLQFFKSRKNDVENDTEKVFSTRGFLQGKLRKRDLMQFPSKATIHDFSPYVIPVTSTIFGRVSGYVAMSHVVSSSLGTFNMAAQQVIVSLFYCLCPIADSLSLTAQSFLPSIYEKPKSIQRTKALNDTIWNFIKAGVGFGLVLVGAVSFLPLLSTYFTPDVVVASLVNSVVPLLVVFFAVHGLMASAEGILMGQKDLSFLGRMYVAFFIIVPYFMLKIKNIALASGIGSSTSTAAVGLTSVWTVFVSYQLVRVASFMARVFYLNHKSNNNISL